MSRIGREEVESPQQTRFQDESLVSWKVGVRTSSDNLIKTFSDKRKRSGEFSREKIVVGQWRMGLHWKHAFFFLRKE